MEMLPEEITKRANRVFSKHSRYEIRNYATNLDENYHILVAREKPLNLDYARPFSNTNDLAKNTPELSKNTADEKAQRDKDLDEFNKKGSDYKDIYIKKEQEAKKSQSEQNLYEEAQSITFEYERHHALGYLYRKMPHTYFVYKRILSEIEVRDQKFKPESLLDFGAGLGSGAWAGIHSYKSLERVAAVEPNVHMRQLGKYLTKEVEPEILWVDSLSMIPGAGSKRGQFDVVILGYVLPELPSASARETVLDALFDRVKENGYFILVESGTPKGYRFINDYRNKIIEMSREEANIVAP